MLRAMAGMPAPFLGFRKLGFLRSCSRIASSMEKEAASYRSGKRDIGFAKVGGFDVEGISIGGHETCVMVPSMKVAFDIGRCPQRAISQDFLLISHPHLDHIGGIAMYIATRALYGSKPPTVIVPVAVKEKVEKLLDAYRAVDESQLAVNLVGLDIGEEYTMGQNYVIKTFRTYHVVPSQGYVIYAIKKKLKPEYIGLPGPKIKELRLSGVEVQDVVRSPEVAFTGDTTADFIDDVDNQDVMNAKLLIMEATFLDSEVTVEHAREFGHIHLSEVAERADKFNNSAILFIHFSARYQEKEITAAIEGLPERLRERVQALTHGY